MGLENEAGVPPRAAARPGRVVAPFAPLSKTRLWTLQRDYYDKRGPRAWSSGEVPYLLTSGPLVARHYAELIEALARDLRAGHAGAFDEREPIYVVELGAGSGRLGFELLRALEHRDVAPFEVVVVLTDAIESNIQSWAANDAFRPYLERGSLRMSHYEAGDDAAMVFAPHAVHRGTVHLANPLVIIANYFFDVLPQDLYSTSGGQLYEDEVALCMANTATTSDVESFHDLFLLPRSVQLRAMGSEDEELLAERLATRVEPERFLFPVLALATLRSFLDLADARLVALIGERPGRQLGLSEQELDDLALDGDPGASSRSVEADGGVASSPGALLAMGIHGDSMSLPVDLSFFDAFARRHAGMLLQPGAEPTALVLACLYLGLGDASELSSSFRRAIDERAPEDVYLAIKAATDRDAGASLAMLLGALRLGGYDTYLFRQCFPLIQAQLAEASEELADELVRVLARTELNEYALEPTDRGDTAFGIATLLAPVGRYSDALSFFLRSIERGRVSAITLYDIALCHLHLENVELALDALERAIELDPGYRAAIELRALTLEERARRASSQPRERVDGDQEIS